MIFMMTFELPLHVINKGVVVTVTDQSVREVTRSVLKEHAASYDNRIFIDLLFQSLLQQL